MTLVTKGRINLQLLPSCITLVLYIYIEIRWLKTPGFELARVKARWVESGGRILEGNNSGSREVVLWLIMFHFLEVCV